LVVCAAPQLDVLHAGFAAGGIWCHVVELEERRFIAAVLGSGEGAPAAVAPPDRTSRNSARPGTAAVGPSRPVARPHKEDRPGLKTRPYRRALTEDSF
jgi:hypothetical protein